LRIARLEQLHDRPDRDVLERGVGAAEESVKVAVHPSIRLIPNIVEGGIIIA
jgi:hypothetical protein